MMTNWWKGLLTIFFLLASMSYSQVSAEVHESYQAERQVVLQGEDDSSAEIARYRSGRRAYRPTPGYQAPTRPATPPARYDAPRRAGGFFGGIGGFMAGAFLGSMLFGSLFGGIGHFSFLGLLIDILVIAVIFMLIRRLWTRRQERHR
ncbi:hypothetical protein [Ammoniphilus sp. CFH 90114]|uniref:hypothetical protein n=1 Tax=Ammoniphilus sp. CFH 90114 TaxID=2493665 RepID=UPI00100F6BCF|nr:hypothetical protein [Ammoniphilus sp. CFH 90114]RXT06261.1 hypothetical protein EIZ39_14325 [Ammoniphilus sp. CFH 90114]